MADFEEEGGPGLHKSLFNKESNLDKYRRMVIGDQGWLKVIYFEFVILFFSLIPGALGLICRKYLYRPLFDRVGKNVVFGRNLTLRHPHKIMIGDNVIIDDECLLDAKGESNSGISIGDYVSIGRFSSLVCKNGDIEIGPHVNIGSTVKIVVAEEGKIVFGSNIDVGSSCHFSGGSYDHSQTKGLPSTHRISTKGISVADFAWIGAGVIVLDGVEIGNKSIVGAGAVVTQNVPPNSIAFGVPAEVKKERELGVSERDHEG
jgi:acetyltransferase-like isoleucine patch superfamily enzyme